MERAIGYVREAAKRGAQVVCLPELFQTQYFCQREDAALFDLAEPIPGPTTEMLSNQARKLGLGVVHTVLFNQHACISQAQALVVRVFLDAFLQQRQGLVTAIQGLQQACAQ